MIGELKASLGAAPEQGEIRGLQGISLCAHNLLHRAKRTKSAASRADGKSSLSKPESNAMSVALDINASETISR